jgi:hypothetical protein
VMKLTFIVLCWTLVFAGAVFIMGYFLQPYSEPAGRGDRPWIPRNVTDRQDALIVARKAMCTVLCQNWFYSPMRLTSLDPILALDHANNIVAYTLYVDGRHAREIVNEMLKMNPDLAAANDGAKIGAACKCAPG